MSERFFMEPQSVHLWRVRLSDFISEEHTLAKLLSDDELERAYRFRFPVHRQRFIVARALLRTILSQYLGKEPQDIIFSYGHRGKPQLQENPLNVQFNVSHSEEVAVYACTLQADIGIDVQHIDDKDHDGIAKRFFNEQEYAEMTQLPPSELPMAFCRLWACKEALIKAIGGGLYVSLEHFSVALHQEEQWISLTHDNRTEKYYLKQFDSYSGYQSAFATNQSVKTIHYWEWTLTGPIKVNVA